MTWPGECGVGVGSDSRARYDSKCIDNSEVDDGKIGNNKVESKVQNYLKSKKLSISKKTIGLDFLPSGARLAFTKWR